MHFGSPADLPANSGSPSAVRGDVAAASVGRWVTTGDGHSRVAQLERSELHSYEWIHRNFEICESHESLENERRQVHRNSVIRVVSNDGMGYVWICNEHRVEFKQGSPSKTSKE